ncbi:MAG: Fic family protein [Chromatiales bacterium]|nr:Fic family protein [Gammaproteobacteria bacterium]MDH3946886.1 Fic family protein [Chromatiales bacterium]
MYIWELENWPKFVWNIEELAPRLAAAHQQQGQLLGQSSDLSDELDLQAQMDALIQNAIRTSEIEGENLNVESVRSSVARQLGLPRAGLRDSTVQTDAIVGMLLEATQNLETALTQGELCQWQAALFPDGPGLVNPIGVGELRGEVAMQVVSGRVDRPTVHFEAPPRDQLEQQLAEFLKWFNQPPKALDGLLRAGIAHLWLVTLHPFDDGNGRVTRAVTDRALAQAEQQSIRFYSLSAAIMERRKEYYEQLERSQKGELDITPWLSWFLSVLEDALKQGQACFDRVLKKTRFWQRHSQTLLTERQIKVLNRLLHVGAALEGAEGFEQGINAEKYKSQVKVSKATATRDLTDLLEKGCLTKLPGGGRSTRYVIDYGENA